MTDDLETQLLELSARVRELEVNCDPDAVAAINEKLDQLLAEQASKPRVFHWGDLDVDDAQAMWTALLEWVQNVLCARYPIATAAMRDCWWEHPSTRDAVTACWFAWNGAYRAGDANPTDPIDWQDTRLPSLITMLGERLASCENGHFPERAGADAMRTVPMDYSTIPL